MPRPSTAKAIAEFTEYQRRRNLSPSTILHRRFRLVALANWLDLDLLDATTEHIEKWLDAAALAPQTRYTYIAYLAAFYRWAQRKRYIRADPTEPIERPKLPRRVPRPWLQEDFTYAVEQADPRMRCFLLLAGFAGARCMEIANLRVEDIDRRRNVLVLRGKGDKERIVPLHAAVYEALIVFGLPRAGFVFRKLDGLPLRPSTVSRYVGRCFHELGSDATAHRGRHAYATAIYELSGGDLRMTQELLGHVSPVSTAIYAGWAPARAAEVVRRLALEAE